MTVDPYHLLLLSNVHRSELHACSQPVRRHPRVRRAWARRFISWWSAHRTTAAAAAVAKTSGAGCRAGRGSSAGADTPTVRDLNRGRGGPMFGPPTGQGM